MRASKYSLQDNFKTFQVYSSWLYRYRNNCCSFISKLFKFIVHDILGIDIELEEIFQNFSSL